MILTPHMLIGAAIGAHSPNAVIAFILGLGSHYLLDSISHWDYIGTLSDLKKPSNRKKIFFDLLISVFAIVLLLSFKPSINLLLIGAFAAVLPDGIELINFIFNISFLKPISNLHLKKIHNKKILTFKEGWLGLIIVCFLAIIVLIF